jgi:hypothetical protein
VSFGNFDEIYEICLDYESERLSKINQIEEKEKLEGVEMNELPNVNE